MFDLVGMCLWRLRVLLRPRVLLELRGGSWKDSCWDAGFGFLERCCF